MKSNWPKPAVLGAAAILASALLAAELALRAAGVAAPEPIRPDVDLGWSPRERPVLLPKPAGVHRVAVLGDEAARGFSRVLQSCLRETLVEVLDFSVQGYGTAQQYVQLQTVVLRYQPDLVVLRFNAANDVRNNSFLLEPRKDRPFFFLDAGGALAVDASFASSRKFKAQSSLRQEILRRSRLLQVLMRQEPPAPLAGDAGAWRAARHTTAALLAAADALVRSSGAQFALVRDSQEAMALCVGQSVHGAAIRLDPSAQYLKGLNQERG